MPHIEYIVQGLYSDGSLWQGTDWVHLCYEKMAIANAKQLLKDPCFDGDLVRVITSDGDLVFEASRP